MSKINFIFSILFSFFLISCDDSKINRTDFFEIDKKEYLDKLEGFWLGQSIANWTGLITEMDKIGNIGQIKTGKFYTRHNWGGKDETNIWSSETSNNEINFVFREKGEIWGSDDDTDIEYMYQELLFQSNQTILSPQDIRDGWLKHIKN